MNQNGKASATNLNTRYVQLTWSFYRWYFLAVARIKEEGYQLRIRNVNKWGVSFADNSCPVKESKWFWKTFMTWRWNFTLWNCNLFFILIPRWVYASDNRRRVRYHNVNVNVYDRFVNVPRVTLTTWSVVKMFILSRIDATVWVRFSRVAQLFKCLFEYWNFCLYSNRIRFS